MTEPDLNRPSKWAKLREPFPAHMIGKLPRVTCKLCSEARGRVCDRHSKSKCDGCGNYISGAHIHLDYVGHAAVTDRINSVDPEWTWSPMAVDERGLPMFDSNGGLWGYLTILGVTRPCYGDSEGKRGADAVKGAISDAIRNGAMRFGVGLDLWSKEDLQGKDVDTPDQVAPVRPLRNSRKTADNPADDTAWLDIPASCTTLEQLTAKAQEANQAGVFAGEIMAAFLTRKAELEAAVKTEDSGAEVA